MKADIKRKLLQGPRWKEFHVYGRGAGPDGKGSGFAWVMVNTGKNCVTWVDGLNQLEAEATGFISALEHVGEGSRIFMRTDSDVIARQFNFLSSVGAAQLDALMMKACDIADKEKWLQVEAKPILRERNLAAKLLDETRRRGPRARAK